MYTQQYKRDYKYWNRYKGMRIPPDLLAFNQTEETILTGVLSTNDNTVTHLMLGYKRNYIEQPPSLESIKRLNILFFKKEYIDIARGSICLSSVFIKSFKDYHGF